MDLQFYGTPGAAHPSIVADTVPRNQFQRVEKCVSTVRKAPGRGLQLSVTNHRAGLGASVALCEAVRKLLELSER